MPIHKNTIMGEYVKNRRYRPKEPSTHVDKSIMTNIVRDVLIIAAFSLSVMAYVRVGALICAGVEDGMLRCVITGHRKEAPIIFETSVTKSVRNVTKIKASETYILDPAAGIH